MNLTNKWCVYRTSHPTGFYYLGKGITTRVVKGQYKGSGVKLRAAYLAGYPKDEWTSVVLDTFAEQEDAYAAEKKLIPWEVLMDPYCLNTCLGGSGMRWGRLTEKQLKARSEKISKAHKGKVMSADARKKISKAAKEQDRTLQTAAMKKTLAERKAAGGLKMPKEFGEAISARNTGVPKSNAAKKKMSEKQLSHPKIACIHCGKECRPALLARWHNDNCRSKK